MSDHASSGVVIPLCPLCFSPHMRPNASQRLGANRPLWLCSEKGCKGRVWPTPLEAFISRGTISTESTDQNELGNVDLHAKQEAWDAAVAARVSLVPRTDTDHEAA